MNNSIKPGKIWLDTEGKRIQAHGGNLWYENEVFYWYGENKEFTTGKDNIWTWGIRYYSSTDLYNWKDEGYLMEAEPENENSIFHPARRLDRPHIIWNEITKKYVCWLKYNDKSCFAIVTSDHFCGPYKVEKEFFQPYGRDCGDFDLAVDEESGKAYLYVECDHKEIISCELSEDYLDINGDYIVHYSNLNPPLTREGTTHFTRNGKHYLITSGMTGYVPNPSETAIADNWQGPYAVQGNPHIKDDSMASFNSQISGVFKYPGKDLYIALADRWVPEYVMTKEKYEAMERVVLSQFDNSVKVLPSDYAAIADAPFMGSANTSISDYVWLPIRFEGEKVCIDWKDEWRIEDISDIG